MRETSFTSKNSFHLYDESSAMKRDELLAERFEAARPRLRRIAQRILGSVTESEDALQEGWLRVGRAGADDVANFEGWLTTVVARVCLDTLKRRNSRREELTAEDPRAELPSTAPGDRPEDEAILADSVGVALLILLEALPPPERVAFVLHDLFDVPFDDIGRIVDRSPEASRQLASRARKRVRGFSTERETISRNNEELVRAFFAASRAGDLSGLVAVLDPNVMLRADKTLIERMGGAQYWQSDDLGTGVRGADAVARTFLKRAQAAKVVLVDGRPGAIWVDRGIVRVAFLFEIASNHITQVEIVADPAAIANYTIDR
jgi:RNA polymerase sigma factor (sigma-70 family)